MTGLVIREEYHSALGGRRVTFHDRAKAPDVRQAGLPSLTATLGENPVAVILAARADLLEALGQRRLDADDARYRRLKNRAYSVVKPEVDELLAAGRYVFRNSPEILTLFVTPATERRRKSRTKAEETEEPVAPSPV